MRRISGILLSMAYLALLFAASTGFAQMYTVTDLGTLGGPVSSAWGINATGQVIGWSYAAGFWSHAFRTAPSSPINPATDVVGPHLSSATGINASGQVVGYATKTNGATWYAFRTAPNSPVNPAADDLGTLGGTDSTAWGINASGQAVGGSSTAIGGSNHAFRTAPNSPINPATDDLGTLGGQDSVAKGINESGQVVGYSWLTGQGTIGGGHAFRTAPNSPINPATDDLGTLGGLQSEASAINASGQVVGGSMTGSGFHAFRTAPNSPINPATDDLGTLGGDSFALSINASGQVVGQSGTIDGDTHAFLYNGNVMYDLNNLIPASSGWELIVAYGINDAGQIAGVGEHNGVQRAFLLTPVAPYNASVQPPINVDGSSIFSAKRGGVPVKFTLTENDVPTCNLPSATISVTRTAGATPGPIEEGTYQTPANSSSKFRIDSPACQYVYNLGASSLGVGTYRVDISINGIAVGHAVFKLN